jgi:hypothetical protein
MLERPDHRNQHALVLLESQLKQRGDLKRVADLLKVSHTYLSLYRSGKLRSIKALEARILVAFDCYPCPHDGTAKQPLDCKRTGMRPRPLGWREAEAIWLACQTCPHLGALKPLTSIATHEVKQPKSSHPKNTSRRKS